MLRPDLGVLDFHPVDTAFNPLISPSADPSHMPVINLVGCTVAVAVVAVLVKLALILLRVLICFPYKTCFYLELFLCISVNWLGVLLE